MLDSGPIATLYMYADSVPTSSISVPVPPGAQLSVLLVNDSGHGGVVRLFPGKQVTSMLPNKQSNKQTNKNF